jgi:hypothetical protein
LPATPLRAQADEEPSMSKFTNLIVDVHNGDAVAGWERGWLELLARHAALVDSALTAPSPAETLGERASDESAALDAEYEAWLDAQDAEFSALDDADLCEREAA